MNSKMKRLENYQAERAEEFRAIVDSLMDEGLLESHAEEIANRKLAKTDAFIADLRSELEEVAA